MSNQLAVIGGQVPAAFAGRKSSLNTAAQANVQASFAVLGYKGKNWRLKYRGEETVLKDERGLPLQALDVVVVGVAAGISKQFYEKGYVEGDNAAPDCFSVNGTTPDPSSPKKQCHTCAVCPKNQWGSKVSENGSKGKACQDSRRVAIIPEGDFENEAFGGPVMMRLPPMSLNNFAQYGAMLDKRGAGMEFVVTRMTFDFDVAYPRIKFEPVRWLTQDEAVRVVGEKGDSGIMANPTIERMLNEAVDEATHDPAAAPAAPSHDPLASGGPAAVFQQPAAAPQPAPEPAPQPTPAPVQAAPQPAPTPAAKPKASPFASAASGAQPAQQTTQVTQPAATPAQAAPAPKPVVQAAPSDMEAAIDSLLNEPV